MDKTEKIIIGRNDKIDLPKLHLFEVDAKIDTGANTSAIHFNHAEEIEVDGKKLLHFTLLDPSHPNFNNKDYYAENFEQRLIKNSFGDSEMRYVITTEILLFNKTWITEFSLSNRGNLKFPVLLGRKLLRKNFLVDVNRTNLSYKMKNKN